MEQSKHNSFLSNGWGILAAATTLVATMIGIYSWWHAPSADLQATVDRGTFYLPPQYPDFEKRVRDALAPQQLRETIKKLAEERNDVADKNETPPSLNILDLSNALVKQVSVDEYEPLDRFHGYWEAEITNTGSLSVKDVAIRLPDTMYAIVKRDDGTSSNDIMGPVVELGDIGVNQKIFVTAWTSSPDFHTLSDTYKPNIYYEDGIGKINLTYEPKLTSLLLANFGKLMAFFASFLIIYLTLGIFRNYKALRPKRNLSE